ncbi:MAG: HEPN domain-containing protein [Lachnospiraceae bacterium]|nr:HEPN domain-containing protein [Lachnospiraceae bacterium]MCI9149604.1 HEPN domain-containing protein [Lachnospiraceae bacterium]
MQDKEKELSKYRLSLANETLANAKMCLDNQFFRDCINRSYYVAFYAIKAVLAVEGVDFKRHKDAVAYFNKKYVAADIFPKELGKRLGRIKMIREESDYSDFFVVSSEDAEKQYKTAIFILENVQAYLKEQNILD